MKTACRFAFPHSKHQSTSDSEHAALAPRVLGRSLSLRVLACRVSEILRAERMCRQSLRSRSQSPRVASEPNVNRSSSCGWRHSQVGKTRELTSYLARSSSCFLLLCPRGGEGRVSQQCLQERVRWTHRDAMSALPSCTFMHKNTCQAQRRGREFD
eukprot:868959-Rhodomonas_salina.1